MKLYAEPSFPLDWMCLKHRALMHGFQLQYDSGDPLKGERHGAQFIVIGRGPCSGGVCETDARERLHRGKLDATSIE